MKIIYLVSVGSYSDYGVHGVFSSKEKAEKYIKLMSAHFIYSEFNEIEEYTLDLGVSELDKGLLPFTVYMAENGDVSSVSEEYSPHAEAPKLQLMAGGIIARYVCAVWAKDRDHAIKIATDMRRAELAKPKKRSE